jgi:hypothetical protein
VGVITFIVIGCQAWETRKAAQAAKESIILTHRPKIIVRNIVIHGLEQLNRHTPMNQLSQDLTGYYTVANRGGLPCTIQSVFEGNFVGAELPMERPDRGNPGRQLNIPVAPGESREIPFGHVVLSVNDTIDLINGKTSEFFIVRIRYMDTGNIIRETSACRRFNPSSNRFSREENEDYEYSD